MGWWREYTEPNDPMDNPKCECERMMEQEKYFEELDDRARWSE